MLVLERVLALERVPELVLVLVLVLALERVPELVLERVQELALVLVDLGRPRCTAHDLVALGTRPGTHPQPGR